MRGSLSFHFRCCPVANVCDAFTSSSNHPCGMQGQPPSVHRRGREAALPRGLVLKRGVGGCILSPHRGFPPTVWPHAALSYASDVWEIWVYAAMPYKGISAEHASTMPVGYYLHNPFGLDYLLYWNLFHIRGWERAVLLNLLVPWSGERTVCLQGVGSSPKTSPCRDGWSSWHRSSFSLWFAILQSFPVKVLQQMGSLVR